MVPQRVEKNVRKTLCNKLSKLITLSIVLIATITAAALAPMTHTAMAAPVNPYGFGVALFKNYDPWNLPATNEVILKRYGIPYDVYNSTDIGNVDLSKYSKVIIASDQNQVFYDAVNASRTWFEDYAENGGVLEIHAADVGSHGGGWIDDLPGGITYVYDPSNLVNIVVKHHPLVRTPNNITDAELDNWGYSIHGYFTAYPAGTVVILQESTDYNAVYIEVPFGSGVILASTQPLEHGYEYHGFFLENSLLYLAPHESLDMEVNVGSIHFRGELAEFYVKTSLSGNAINASVWEVTLYTEGGTTQADLLPNLEAITVGLCRISYTIPTDAVTGTYTLSVKASYRTGMTTATGHATASFLVSPALTSQNSYITEVKNNIATVVVPDLGTIKADLNEIDAKVVDIDGNVATIQTDIGTMKTDVSNIDGIVTALEDDTTTIGDTTTNTYWFSIAAMVLAAAGAGLAAVIVILVRKKPKP